MSFEKKNFLKECYHITGPMISGVLMMAVDRVILAKYSKLDFAASGTATILITIIMTCFIKAVSIYRIHVSQAIGENDETKIQSTSSNAITFGIFFAIVFLLCYPLFIYFPSTSERGLDVILKEISYLQIGVIYGAFIILNSSFSGLFISYKESKKVFYITILSQLINIAFTYLLVFGISIFPELGIQGSALGTLVATLFTTISFSYFLIKNYSHRVSINCKNLVILKSKEFLTGIQMGGSSLVENIGILYFIWMISDLGVFAMSLNNIALSINSVATVPIVGIAVTTSIYMSRFKGASDSMGVSSSAKFGFLVSFIFVGFVVLLEVLFPKTLTSLFINDEYSISELEQVYAIGSWIAPYAISFLVATFFSACLEANTKTKEIFWIKTLGMYLFMIPLVYVYSQSNTPKVHGFWWILTGYEFLIGFIFLYKYLGIRRASEKNKSNFQPN